MMTTLSRIMCALALACAAACSGRSADRPNIVLILADDLGYGDPRCYNPESKIPTPGIDRLASEGMRFTDAHTPSAVCTPTRYALLTGRYAWRSRLKKGVLDGYSPYLIEEGRTTLASFLGARGYRTAAVGKWHLGLGRAERTDYAQPLQPGPNAAGFDYFFGIPASLDMPPYVFVENERVREAPSATIEASERRRTGGAGFWRAGAIAPSFRHNDVHPTLTEKAVAWLGEQTAETPFFLYLPLASPHTPWLPTAPFEGRSGAGPYGDFVAEVDDTVGRVLQALDASGQAGNTLVVFTSDNGANWLREEMDRYGHRSNGHLRGQKADIWEGGHRVPFIARWPGRIPAGARSDALIGLTDMLATMAEILGEPLPESAGEDSRSILPVLLGRPASARQSIVHHSITGMFGIREGPWKLIPGLGSFGFSEPKELAPEPGGPVGQLYQLERDPAETRNLWSEEPEVRERLLELLRSHGAEFEIP